eukprot:gene6361-9745_t
MAALDGDLSNMELAPLPLPPAAPEGSDLPDVEMAAAVSDPGPGSLAPLPRLIITGYPPSWSTIDIGEHFQNQGFEVLDCDTIGSPDNNKAYIALSNAGDLVRAIQDVLPNMPPVETVGGTFKISGELEDTENPQPGMQPGAPSQNARPGPPGGLGFDVEKRRSQSDGNPRSKRPRVDTTGKPAFLPGGPPGGIPLSGALAGLPGRLHGLGGLQGMALIQQLLAAKQQGGGAPANTQQLLAALASGQPAGWPAAVSPPLPGGSGPRNLMGLLSTANAPASSSAPSHAADGVGSMANLTLPPSSTNSSTLSRLQELKQLQSAKMATQGGAAGGGKKPPSLASPQGAQQPAQQLLHDRLQGLAGLNLPPGINITQLLSDGRGQQHKQPPPPNPAHVRQTLQGLNLPPALTDGLLQYIMSQQQQQQGKDEAAPVKDSDRRRDADRDRDHPHHQQRREPHLAPDGLGEQLAALAAQQQQRQRKPDGAAGESPLQLKLEEYRRQHERQTAKQRQPEPSAEAALLSLLGELAKDGRKEKEGRGRDSKPEATASDLASQITALLAQQKGAPEPAPAGRELAEAASKKPSPERPEGADAVYVVMKSTCHDFLVQSLEHE